MKTITEYCKQISSIDEYCKQISSIDEYLSINVDKNKIYKYKFPETPNKEELIEYFEAMGFIKLDTLPDNMSDYPTYYEIIKKQKYPFYILGSYNLQNKYSHYIIFGNGGIINHENPFYICRTDDDDDTKTMSNRERFIVCYGDNFETGNIVNYDNYTTYRYLIIDKMSNKNKKA